MNPSISLKLRQLFVGQGVVDLPHDMVEGAEDILSPLEFFHALDHPESATMCIVQYRQDAAATSSSCPLDLCTRSVLRVVDPTGSRFSLLTIIDILHHMFGDLSKLSFSYDSHCYDVSSTGSVIFRTEIFLGGLSVASIKYLQSTIGESCTPVPVFMEFYLEHLSVYACQRDSVYDLQVGNRETYRDLFSRREDEVAAYCGDDTSVENEKLLFERLVSESQLQFRMQLFYLAYTSLLSAHHVACQIRTKTGVNSERYRNCVDTVYAMYRDIVSALLRPSGQEDSTEEIASGKEEVHEDIRP